MTQSILFATYLNDLLTSRKMTKDELIYNLGYRTAIPVTMWLEGRGRPMIDQLSALAAFLRVDPVEMVLGWVIDQCPELEDVLRKEVLDSRRSTFPRSDDLALRAPKPLRWSDVDK
jgi:hypothetical protein